MSESVELISVIVIGRNEGPRLERCLNSILQMRKEGFSTELIYVDSGSSDLSLEVAQRLGAMTVALAAPHTTAALGRNAGWRLAQGKLVLFLDGDTVLDPDFVVESLADFTANTAIVWGHRRELYPSASVYQRVLDLDWIYAPGESTFCGGDALFRRAVLELTNGFDPTLIAGEEPELCRRVLDLGFVIQHVDRPMTGHDLDIKHFHQYWRRATRAGHAYAEVSDRFATSRNPFWTKECCSNRMRAWALIATAVTMIIAAIMAASVWPIVLWIASLSGWAARTAWKARWKTRKWDVLLLYGLHSLFQQLPIYLGQLQYQDNRRRGRRSELLEYKGTGR